MLTINMLRSHSAIRYAAEELKKYLRMMMPEGGEIEITYAPQAKDGFRLGLLEDFGLPFEGEDPKLDDVLHIETDTQGGILAGSNPRSVLFSVYRYLRENGCRWLYPGIDGDYVPMQDIVPVSYHKLADHRYRGFCDEGYTSQTNMLECIEYYTKLELNTFNLEFFNPVNYYNRYYGHMQNETHRMPEPVSDTQVLQWRRMCETELGKRGLHVTGIGHGWSGRAMGFPENPKAAGNEKDDINLLTPEQRSCIAMLDGERKLYTGRLFFSQLCMSNPLVQEKMSDAVVEYAKNHQNYTRITFSLSDGSKNYCECPECIKMRPADWRNIILNKIDEKLTAAGLDTKIGFSMYVDTMFPPEHIKLNNPSRFAMSYCPITRDYTTSITEDTPVPEVPEFIYNGWKAPTTEEGYALLKQWQKCFSGDFFCYEYHFWRTQYRDPSGYYLAKRLYEDVRSLKTMGVAGMVEDGSQRSAFPNGFPVYIYAETLMNRDCDFEVVRADYFKHIYGSDWQKVDAILRNVSKAFDFEYMQGLHSEKPEFSQFYAPSRVSRLAAVHDLAEQIRFHFAKHKNMPVRVQTVSWRLLNRYAEWLDWMADIVTLKAQGRDYEAKALSVKFTNEFGAYELELERYYDHGLCTQHTTTGLCSIANRKTDVIVE